MAVTIPDATINAYYQQFLSGLTPQTIDYQDITTEEQTKDEFSASEAAYLEPYYTQQIKSVLASAKAQRAEYDADAASRGMSSSTWLSDAKGRTSQQAQTDVASLQAAYTSALAQNTNDLYQAQLDRLLTVSQQNASNRLTVDEYNANQKTNTEALAYQRALEMYNVLLSQSSGSSSKKSYSSSDDTVFDISDLASTLKATASTASTPKASYSSSTYSKFRNNVVSK